MAILKWNGYMVPVLETLSDGREWSRRDLIDEVAASSGVTDDEKLETISSGQLLYSNRIGWAMSYLKKAGAVHSPARARFRVTDFGRDLLGRNPQGLTEKDLIREAGEKRMHSTWKSLNEATGSHQAGQRMKDTEDELDPLEEVDHGVKSNNA